MQTVRLFLSLLLFGVCSFAQDNTDIFLFDMAATKEGYQFSNPRNITNRDGYDNQPVFSQDGHYLYYSSIQDGKQSDIYGYSLLTKEHTQITKTPESEYSPLPLANGKEFSTVRVETDNRQRIWRFPIQGGEPQLVADVDQVGYHCWLDDESLAIFRIEETMNLKLLSVADAQTTLITTGIGRALALIPIRKTLSFVSKGEQSVVKEWTREKRIVDIVGLPGGEDFAWASNGDLFSANGKYLYKFSPGKDQAWVRVLDASQIFTGAASRIAISQQVECLAVVALRQNTAAEEQK